VLARKVEVEVLPWCRQHDVGVLAWAPLNGGWLTGKYQAESFERDSRAGREPEHFDHRNETMRTRKRDLVTALSHVAEEAGLTLIQLALGFVLASPAVSAALIGPRLPQQMPALLAAADVTLGDDVLRAIDGIIAPGVTVNPVDDG
jgi:aryl-alcohol dehydrogenase-like predicted oxidoreductase